MDTKIVRLLFQINTVGMEEINNFNSVLSKLGDTARPSKIVKELEKINPAVAKQFGTMARLSHEASASISQVTSALNKQGISFDVNRKKGKGAFVDINGEIVKHSRLLDAVTGRTKAKEVIDRKVSAQEKAQLAQKKALAVIDGKYRSKVMAESGKFYAARAKADERNYAQVMRESGRAYKAQIASRKALGAESQRIYDSSTKSELSSVREKMVAHTRAGNTALRAARESGVGINKLFGKMNDSGDLVGGVLGKIGYRINQQGDFINDATGEMVPYDKAVGQLGKTTRRFQMQYLGVMFGAMQMKMMFQRLINPALQVAGVFKIITATLQILFLPVAMEVLKVLLPITQAIMRLSYESKMVVGSLGLFGLALFSILFFAAQAMLFLSALKTMLIGVAGITASTSILTIASMLLLNPVFWVLMAVLIVFTVLWINNWANIQKVTGAAVGQIGRVLFNLVKLIGALFGGGGDIGDIFWDLVMSVVGAFAGLGAIAITVFSGMVVGIIKLLGVLLKAFFNVSWSIGSVMGVLARTIVDMFASSMEQSIGRLLELVDALKNGDFSKVGEIFTRPMESIDFGVRFSENKAKADEMGSAIIGTMNHVADTLTNTFETELVGSVSGFNDTIADGVDALNLMADYGLDPFNAIQIATAGNTESFRKKIDSLNESNKETSNTLDSSATAMDEFNNSLTKTSKPIEEMDVNVTDLTELTEDQNIATLIASELFGDELPEGLMATVESYDILNPKIKENIGLLDGVTHSAEKALKPMKKLAGTAYSYSGQTHSVGGKTYQTAKDVYGNLYSVGTQFISDVASKMSKATTSISSGFSSYNPYSLYNDFIWRAGSSPVAISSSDNLIGTKSGFGGSSVNITVSPTITVNNEVSREVDLDRLKRSLSEEIADEVETSIRRIRI